MKKIAVSQRLMLNEKYYELREGLDVRWGRLFSELGFLPIALPLECNFESYFENISINGILLTGGDDLSIFNDNELSHKRDQFELKLVDFGLKHDIPIFGVCRGMQLIGKYFDCSFKPVENHIAVEHELKISGGSDLKLYLDKLEIVNSYHGFAISSVNGGLLVSAQSDDHVIEAIEHTTHRIFGQMWHCERSNPFKEKELDLISAFFDE